MKKMLAMLLAAMMLLSLAACGSGSDGKTPSGSEDNTPPSSQQTGQDTPDPGTSQDGNKGGTSQKADNGKMESDEKLNEDMPAIPLSELTSIGKPVGYTVKGTKAIGTHTTGIKFTPDSGSIADGDVEQYAAAIWNLCIDQVDNGALGDREVGDEDGEVYASMSDAKESDEKFSWFYNINGKRLQATVWIEDDMIMLGFSDWSNFIGD